MFVTFMHKTLYHAVSGSFACNAKPSCDDRRRLLMTRSTEYDEKIWQMGLINYRNKQCQFIS